MLSRRRRRKSRSSRSRQRRKMMRTRKRILSVSCVAAVLSPMALSCSSAAQTAARVEGIPTA
jgi:hypothetical protein